MPNLGWTSAAAEAEAPKALPISQRQKGTVLLPSPPAAYSAKVCGGCELPLMSKARWEAAAERGARCRALLVAAAPAASGWIWAMMKLVMALVVGASNTCMIKADTHHS
jgi:hypothetical protein